LAGSFGSETIAGKLAIDLKQFRAIAQYADSIALGIVVLMISYLSLILGELVPKDLALGKPEGIASLRRCVGCPAWDLPWYVFSFSTRLVIKLLPIRQSENAPVAEEKSKGSHCPRD
jgi:putative hemolysin